MCFSSPKSRGWRIQKCGGSTATEEKVSFNIWNFIIADHLPPAALLWKVSPNPEDLCRPQPTSPKAALCVETSIHRCVCVAIGNHGNRRNEITTHHTPPPPPRNKILGIPYCPCILSIPQVSVIMVASNLQNDVGPVCILLTAGRAKLCMPVTSFSLVQFLHRSGRRGDTRDLVVAVFVSRDPVPVFSARDHRLSGSGMGRDVQSMTSFMQRFLCRS